MIVTFYRFTKKLNSTAIPPTEGGTSLDLRLKTPCTMERPELEISAEAAADILSCNYAYVPAFQRRYFITGREFVGPMVIFSLAVDDLGTYEAEIKASRQYVLRSASRSNGDIIDNMYPLRGEISRANTTINNPYSANFDTNDGVYVVGLVGSGATQYYVFSASSWQGVLMYILSDAYLADVMGVLALALNSELRLAVDPLDYVASVIWLPFVPNSALYTQVSSVKVGLVDVTCTAYKITQPVQSLVFNFANLHSHPLAATRGTYLNMAPYTRVMLHIPPFGIIPIDTTLLRGAVSVDAIVNVDLRTGTCTLSITGNYQQGGDVIGQVLSRQSAMLGIPQQLSQVRQAGVGLSTLTSSIGALTAGIGTGDAIGVIKGGLQAIGDVAQSQIAQASTMGSTGGFDGLQGNLILEYVFYLPVDEANTQLGRPLCEYVQLSTLSGYCLCSADSDIAIQRATPDEIEAILSAMRGGFYLE